MKAKQVGDTVQDTGNGITGTITHVWPAMTYHGHPTTEPKRYVAVSYRAEVGGETFRRKVPISRLSTI